MSSSNSEEPLALALAIALNATIHGWLDRNLLRKERAIETATEAALLLAIDLNGAGNEQAAINRVKTTFNAQHDQLAEQIAKGYIRGASRGGYDR